MKQKIKTKKTLKFLNKKLKIKARGHAHVRKDRTWKVVDKAMKVKVNSPFDARGLSTRDAEFVSNFLRGMPREKAMQLASKSIGCDMTDSGASVAASKVMAKPEVQSAIVRALEDAGITDKLIAGKLGEGLDAMAFTQLGHEHEDYRTRLGYIQTILKVKGQMGPDTENKTAIINYQSFKDEEEA